MHRFRFAILGAAAALALGTAGAIAMEQTGGGGGTDPDAHGDAVASAARNCPHSASGVQGHGVHGACVSAIASTEGQENRDKDEGNSARVEACKAADKTEDAAEKAPAKGDAAAKANDKKEDKAEHKAFAACVSGGASASK